MIFFPSLSHLVLVPVFPGVAAADDDKPGDAGRFRRAEQVQRALRQRPESVRSWRSVS